MTFGLYEFDEGASIHEHSHPHEEVWQVLEGELDITIAGITRRAGPGFAGIVQPDTLHSIKAVTNGRAMVVNYPSRSIAPVAREARS